MPIPLLVKPDDGYPKYAWPGGYPIYYLDRESNVLCADCANREIDDAQGVVASDINYEDTERRLRGRHRSCICGP